MSVLTNTVARNVCLLALVVTTVVVLVSSKLSAYVQRSKESVLIRQELVYVPSINQSRLAFLGYDQAAADVLWIRSLNYFARHLIHDRNYPWLTGFIDQIIELDPKFKAVYWWAGAALLYGRMRTNSVVHEANQYYKKALEQFPNDHESAYRLGMNYHAELQSDDPETKARYRKQALLYLEMAASMPDAPRRISELVASLNVKYGADELALQYLTDLYLRTKDPKELARLEMRMRAVSERMDGQSKAEALSKYKERWLNSLYYASDIFFGLVQTQTVPSRVYWKALLSPDTTVTDSENIGRSNP